MKTPWYKAGLLCLSLVGSLTLVELLLTFTKPMQYIVPVMDWVPEYGCISFPNREIINAKPRQWKYVYTTNTARYRGPLLATSDPSKKTVIALGDSNLFGWGLNDADTVPAQLQKELGHRYRVYNMANGGWSLPQQIRRYLEQAEPYKPDFVMLHMAANDLNDKAYGINWVARAEDLETITLHNAPTNPSATYRQFLPVDSPVYQLLLRSQIFMRCKTLIKKKLIHGFAELSTETDGNTQAPATAGHRPSIPSSQVIVMDEKVNEQRYQKLITAFAKRLHEQNVPLIFLTDEAEVYRYAKLKNTLADLHQKGWLHHQPISEWFTAKVDYPPSLQGHPWGTQAAHRLATELAKQLQERPTFDHKRNTIDRAPMAH